MSIPYRVTVTSKGKNDIQVDIKPQPVATKEEYTLVVAGKFQKALMDSTVRNTMMGRARLKKALEDIITDFQAQGLIRPKEKEGGWKL